MNKSCAEYVSTTICYSHGLDDIDLTDSYHATLKLNISPSEQNLLQGILRDGFNNISQYACDRAPSSSFSFAKLKTSQLTPSDCHTHAVRPCFFFPLSHYGFIDNIRTDQFHRRREPSVSISIGNSRGALLSCHPKQVPHSSSC